MTQEEIMEMARQSGVLAGYEGEPSLLITFAEMVATKERNACADSALDAISFNGGTVQIENHVYRAIRARGKS